MCFVWYPVKSINKSCVLSACAHANHLINTRLLILLVYTCEYSVKQGIYAIKIVSGPVADHCRVPAWRHQLWQGQSLYLSGRLIWAASRVKWHLHMG